MLENTIRFKSGQIVATGFLAGCGVSLVDIHYRFFCLLLVLIVVWFCLGQYKVSTMKFIYVDLLRLVCTECNSSDMPSLSIPSDDSSEEQGGTGPALLYCGLVGQFAARQPNFFVNLAVVLIPGGY